MTKEEAVKELKILREDYWDEYGDTMPALDMAIKTLEQELCEDKIIEWKKDFKEYINALSIPRDDYKGIMEYIDELPFTPQQTCEDCISRQAAIDIASGFCHPANVAKELKRLPSVQPKYNISEWCHDCSEYDQDKHCCPRFNKVIRNTVEEIKQPKMGHWIEGKTDNPNIHNILCSCCFEGYPSKGHANSQYTKEKFQWCPKCGARMIESQESEEK